MLIIITYNYTFETTKNTKDYVASKEIGRIENYKFLHNKFRCNSLI